MAPLGYKAPWPSNQSFITFVVPDAAAQRWAVLHVPGERN